MIFLFYSNGSDALRRDGSFSFFFKPSFRYEKDDEKTKNETIVFKKLVILLTKTFVNDR